MKKTLTQYSTKELKNKRKSLLNISISLGIFILFTFIFLTYSAIKTKNYAFIAIGLSSFLGIIPLFIQLSIIQKEINSREN